MSISQFPNMTADGSTDEADLVQPKRSRLTWEAEGDFGGGTLTLEYRRNGSSVWISTGASLTATGAVNVEVHGSVVYRQTLSGATSPDVDGALH